MSADAGGNGGDEVVEDEVLSEYDSEGEEGVDVVSGGGVSGKTQGSGPRGSLAPRGPGAPVRVPEVSAGGEVDLFPGSAGGEGRLLSVCASADGGVALAGCSDGVLRQVGLSKEGAVLLASEASVVADVGAPVTCVGYRPESEDTQRSARGVAVAGTTAGEVCWVHVGGAKVLHRCPLADASSGSSEAPSAVHCMAHAPLKGSVLAAAGDDGRIYVMDEAQKRVVETLHGGNAMRTSAGHTSRVSALCWADEGKADVLYSGGWDMTVQVWDRRVGPGSVSSLYGPYLCGDALDVRGTTLLTGSRRSDAALQLWDLRGAGGLLAAESHALSAAGPTDVYAARFAGEDASRVLAGGGHGQVALLPSGVTPLKGRTWRFTHPDALPCYALAVRPGNHPAALAAMGPRMSLLPLA